jgi:hypothetical protein
MIKANFRHGVCPNAQSQRHVREIHFKFYYNAVVRSCQTSRCRKSPDKSESNLAQTQHLYSAFGK